MKNRLTLRIALTLVTALTVGAQVGFTEPQPDLTGVYRCQGKNPDGNPYAGIVEIAKYQNTYRIRWTIAQRQVHIGIGILNSDLLAVSYYSPGIVGVIVYRVEQDGGRLVGQWTPIAGGGELYGETLTKVSTIEPSDAPDVPPGPADDDLSGN